MYFATWATSTSGGFLRADVEQNTDWSIDYNLRLARTADEAGFYAILFPTRYSANGPEGNDGQLDPFVLASAAAVQTKQIHLLTAVLPAFVPPALLAKTGATLDQLSGGRWHVNLVSGWFKHEHTSLSASWLDHEDRYKRSEEYIEVLRGLWQNPEFQFKGEYYHISGGTMRPQPVQKPYPAIFQGGNSERAQQMAGKYADWYFMNGGKEEELLPQIRNVSEIAAANGRKVRFAVNAFVIARETEEEARNEYEFIISRANVQAIEAFKEKTKEAKGMWKHLDDISSFVGMNEGLRTGLIGSYSQVAEKIRSLQQLGIDLLLLAFRFPIEEIQTFSQKVAPLVREKQSV